MNATTLSSNASHCHSLYVNFILAIPPYALVIHIDHAYRGIDHLSKSSTLLRLATLWPLGTLKVDNPLFATTANTIQLYHSPRAKILAFK